ncbi:MAG: MT-A70 family methyltransferase [Actinomycetota bacterium]|nr:MT-A70 family methyltransferase [Actinomycetota bacterium]
MTETTERIAGYRVHPAAAMFPMMPSSELAELAKDIGQHGLHEPIVLHKGMVLDGRNRLKACTIAGYKPQTVEWDGEGSPEAYVFSTNVLRRHLQDGQRVMLAAQLLPRFEEQAKARQKAGKAVDPTLAPAGAKVPAAGKAAAQVAAVAGVGTRSVERAKAVIAKAPELAAKVLRGESSLKQAEKEIRRAEQHVAIAKYVLPEGKYNVIVADPPWKFDVRDEDETHRGNCPYPPMPLDDITAMGPNVGRRADKDCILFLWTTKQHLLDNSATRVAYAWGFEPRTFWEWVKVDKKGDLRLGAGNWGRNCSEHVLVCTRGKPAVDFSAQPSVFFAPRQEHSRKPDEFFAIVERCCLGTGRLEMFARESRPRWETSGAEATQFDSKPQAKCGAVSGTFVCSSPAGHIGSHRSGDGRHLWPAGERATPEPGACGATDGKGVGASGPCFHPAGHTGVHSNGGRTWSDRKPKGAVQSKHEPKIVIW